MTVFSPRMWQDLLAPFISGANLIDLETRLSNFVNVRLPQAVGASLVGVSTAGGDLAWIPGPFNVRDPRFGATGNGSTDDSTSFATTITAVPGSGTSVDIPRSTYALGSTLTLDSLTGIHFRGQTPATNSSGGGTVLLHTATGTTPLISAQKAQGLVFEDMSFLYNSSSFTGHLLDLRGAPPLDTAKITFRNCFFGSQPTSLRSAQSLVRLLGSNSINFENCTFFGAINAIWGQEAGSGTDCNAVNFKKCLFQGFTSFPVRNPGSAWTFESCAFEPLASGQAGAMYTESTLTMGGCLFLGCWFGDVTASGGEWINVVGHGLVMLCNVVNFETPSAAIRVYANNSRGLVSLGNVFAGSGGASTALDFQSTTGHTGVISLGNRYVSCSDMAGTLPVDMLRQAGDGLMRYGGKLVATGGIGAGNSATATGPVGTVVKKIQVFDDSGTALGYLPVYSTIT